jgi:hypothetical protein
VCADEDIDDLVAAAHRCLAHYCERGVGDLAGLDDEL